MEKAIDNKEEVIEVLVDSSGLTFGVGGCGSGQLE